MQKRTPEQQEEVARNIASLLRAAAKGGKAAVSQELERQQAKRAARKARTARWGSIASRPEIKRILEPVRKRLAKARDTGADWPASRVPPTVR